MPFTIRVSTPGNDALTDTNIDHYSVYADSNNLLIKEFSRGTIDINNNAWGTITHGLGYIPYALCFMKNGNNFENIAGGNMYGNRFFSTGTGDFRIRNETGGTKTFYYQIFYDNGTASL